MPTYTVHAPPPKKGEAMSPPDRFVFVRDGFHVWAFLLAPLWLLWRRLWPAFVLFVVLSIVLGLGLRLIGASSTMQFLASLLVALLVGFEAASIRRRKLAWHGWNMLGFVVGEDLEMAERRFFTEWSRRAATTPPPPPVARAPEQTVPARLPPDVIGLFPEPSGGR